MTNVLRSLREQKGISQDELASELKISRQTLSKYENEETKFSLDIIKKLARFFDVDYSCFIDNKMPPERAALCCSSLWFMLCLCGRVVIFQATQKFS